MEENLFSTKVSFYLKQQYQSTTVDAKGKSFNVFDTKNNLNQYIQIYIYCMTERKRLNFVLEIRPTCQQHTEP